MFRNALNTTSLFNPAANDFFCDRIDGDMILDDSTFVSSLRALVAPRLKDDDTLTLTFCSSSYSASQLGGMSTDRALRAITEIIRDEYTRENRIVLHTFCNYDDTSNRAWTELVKSSFEGAFPGWHRVEKVTQFFQKKFSVVCFINPDLRSVQIYTEQLNLKNLHYLQCGIFAYLPWYFDPKDGVSDLEMDLIKSLQEKTSDKYEECLAKIAAQYDFRTQRIRRLLKGFETKYEQLRLRDQRNELERCNHQLDALQHQIREWIRKKADIDITITGLETKINQGEQNGDSEIMEYFLCNNRLFLVDVDNSRMTFIAKGYLTYYDEDAAKRFIDNSSSQIYYPRGNDGSRYIPNEDMKRLMTAIFLDNKLRVKVCAAYTLELSGGCDGLASYRYGAEYRDCTPNPHIDGYHCLGNYREAINELLMERRYIEAVEQCVASCSSLNFCDPTVLGEFCLRLYGTKPSINIRCIELPDGSVVTPKEAIEYLKQEAESNG